MVFNCGDHRKNLNFDKHMNINYGLLIYHIQILILVFQNMTKYLSDYVSSCSGLQTNFFRLEFVHYFLPAISKNMPTFCFRSICIWRTVTFWSWTASRCCTDPACRHTRFVLRMIWLCALFVVSVQTDKYFAWYLCKDRFLTLCQNSPNSCN